MNRGSYPIHCGALVNADRPAATSPAVAADPIAVVPSSRDRCPGTNQVLVYQLESGATPAPFWCRRCPWAARVARPAAALPVPYR